ncbi:MAG: imidazole glycerol phosphate synthase subunit HisH [Sulfuricurvum sp.]|uniref:imidazole glycerol phosphate synthase subunit HisH n=1 Tax=Sulfuricurvum sp. TaxID=2025608 RepID=UPI00272743C3|nr:imidazole glycerol phosphate synthase subunit HisH [Sulfuricurvum sp.]MDO9055594.1 imidazole glycerol phosphate synthase subunit HisH [Sulfuricurvum sp.]
MIAIVDYNMGNLASVKNAFDLLGEKVVVESDPEKLKRYDRIILPGVGAFGDAMEHLRERGMDEAVREYAQSGKYLLGICLGMQLLFESSEEFGISEGLGLIQGRVVAFDTSRFHTPLKVPHMGWNRMFTTDHPLFQGLDAAHYLYFVHSYHALCTSQSDSIGESVYGYRFSSAVAHDNVMGIQPHPEKSHDNGLNILKNFINL